MAIYWILAQISMILQIQLLQPCKTSVMQYYFLCLTLSLTLTLRETILILLQCQDAVFWIDRS